jgi:hypothetical protein
MPKNNALKSKEHQHHFSVDDGSTEATHNVLPKTRHRYLLTTETRVFVHQV